jgi:hypothetical protein
MKDIRELPLEVLPAALKQKLLEMPERFDGIRSLYLHQQNKHNIHYLLARMTRHIEAECGMESTFEMYVSRSIKKPFEVEHIWGDDYSQHSNEFDSQDNFSFYRNRFGGLLLLPQGFNQSLGAGSYAKKNQAYFGQNLLARSLNDQCYVNNPSFLAYVQRSGLSFKAHQAFHKADLDERQELYEQICEEIWSPDRLDEEVS